LRRLLAHPLPVLGIVLKLASVGVFAGMTVCVKLLGRDIPAGQTLFFRGLISILILALIAGSTGRLHLLKTRDWRSHALRSLSGTVSMFCLFIAVTMIPLADLTAITFTSPMFLTVLAMVFLGERIHRFRWTALGVGFVGVLITIGPHLSFASGASAGVVIALVNAVFSAIAMMFLRRMAVGEHAITITFYFFFDEIPSLSVWIGAPLIVGAGLIILWREYALKKQLSAPTAAA
jgi:drug/metabolite transporter (DMT)-like permease